jgi:hypothetical protein
LALNRKTGSSGERARSKNLVSGIAAILSTSSVYTILRDGMQRGNRCTSGPSFFLFAGFACGHLQRKMK